jgi:hypothetical protein
MVVDAKIDFINLTVYRQGEVAFTRHPSRFCIPFGSVRFQLGGKLRHCPSNGDAPHDGAQSVCFHLVLFQVEHPIQRADLGRIG